MVNEKILKKLFEAFPNAIINRCLEFVAEPNPKVNSYFTLEGIETELDVQCKLLEWLSREAYKSEHYKGDIYNARVHEYHRDGINSFLGTDFTHEDMKLIYSKLGNGVNRELTLEFIQSGFNTEILTNNNDERGHVS